MIHYPEHSLSLVGRSDQDPEVDQTSGVQFAIETPDGQRHVYGDQSWVAHGVAIRAGGPHPGGRVVWRTISISYGEWVDPTAELLNRARTHLKVCGGCDAGLLTGCTCTQADPRAVIADLVAELERLRGGDS